jgi:hypothetical protein
VSNQLIHARACIILDSYLGHSFHYGSDWLYLKHVVWLDLRGRLPRVNLMDSKCPQLLATKLSKLLCPCF